MDNFDPDEKTKSGKGASHDNILMLFQNQYLANGEQMRTISTLPSDLNVYRTLIDTLFCQELVKIGKFSGRCQVPSSFLPVSNVDFNEKIEFSEKEFQIWALLQHQNISRTEIKTNIPSFAAMKSLLHVTFLLLPVIIHLSFLIQQLNLKPFLQQ